jgi:DNA-binding transcriptional LysR family regulator
MDVRRLELLRELSERGSIAAVAKATLRTPSAVSQQLKILEREAGLPLTERAGRGIVLTDAGRALARTAADVATALEAAESLWEEFRSTPRGVVRLVTFPTGGQMLLPGLLTAIAVHPGLSVACTDQDQFVEDFADLTPDYDVVIADSLNALRPTWIERGLAAVPLLSEPIDVALREDHPLAAKNSISPKDLVGETWVGIAPGSPYERILGKIEAASGSAAHVGQRFFDNGIVEQMVLAGHGIAILPRYTTRAHGLVTRPLRDIAARRIISALMRPDRAVRPSVRVVVEALRSLGRQIEAANTVAAPQAAVSTVTAAIPIIRDPHPR